MTAHAKAEPETAERDGMMRWLRQAWDVWRRVGQFMGDWIGRVALTASDFTLFRPFAVAVRLWRDPLEIKPGHQAQGLDRGTRDLALDEAQRLY